MAARVQIILEAKDASSGVLRAITGQFGELGSLVEEMTSKNVNWGNVAQMAATMVITGVKDAVKVTTEYTEAVRDQMLISGQGAEASSRFIQVLDDYQISADDAKTATRALTKEGLAPTIETIAELSGQYQQLNTVEEKNAFVMKNLGRSGQQWLNLLNQGPTAIMAMNDAVNQNLILNEQNIQAYEEYRLGLDAWNDSIMAAKVALGNELLPVMTEVMTGIANGNAIREEANRLMMEGAAHNREEALAMAEANVERLAATEATKAQADALSGELVPSMQDAAAAAAEMSKENTTLLGTITSIQSETERYTSTQEDLRAKMTELKTAYQEGQVPQEEYKAKVKEITAAMKENELAHIQAGNKIVFSLVQQKMAIDGLSDTEMAALERMGVGMGIFEQESVDMAKTFLAAASNMVDNAGAMDDALRDPLGALIGINEKVEGLAAKSGQMWDYYVNIHVSGHIPNLGALNQANQAQTNQCFVAGTLITMADGTTKPIEDIAVDDIVLTYDFEAKKNVPARVTATHYHPAEQTDGYLLINGIGVTGNHQMWTPEGWVPAEDLKFGDCLVRVSGKLFPVVSIQSIPKSVPTYNLHVDNDSHNYYADGVLVHNKQTGGTVYAGAPYMVGERGAEPFFPSQNGRILGHAESLHALSLGGGGGQTNYFYGNVELTIGSDASAGIMNIR